MPGPSSPARRAAISPVVLLIGSGGRVDYMRTKLRRLGGAVASASTASDAAALFRECSSFDAVVINADAPEGGWAIAQELKKVAPCAAPVWIVSNQSPASYLRQKARASGVQFCRRKEGLPWLLGTLVRRSLDRVLCLAIVVEALLEPAMLACSAVSG
jgi:hypothetical protein